MSAKKGGLGKGVNALFRDKETNTTLHGAVTELPLASVVPNSQQARRIFDEQALQELSESIRTYGIVQPLVVRAIGEGDMKLKLPENVVGEPPRRQVSLRFRLLCEHMKTVWRQKCL